MSSSSQAPQKKSKGRQKIKMQKIENESNLRVTFSKRRAGLFKKASELCVLCAAKILIIVFSPMGKAFSYGHPGVDSVMDRYLNGDIPNPTSANARLDRMTTEARNSNICTQNSKLTELRSMLDMERKRAKKLDLDKRIGMKEGWIPPPFEDFSLENLIVFERTIKNFQNHLNEEKAKFMSLSLDPTSGFNDTNEQYATLSQGLNNVATGFTDHGLHSMGGISATNKISEVKFPPEFNSWASDFSETGVYETSETSATKKIGGVSVPNELWAAGFCEPGVYIGNRSAVNNVGTIHDLNEFGKWAPCFNDTGNFATGEMGGANNVGAVSLSREHNIWPPGFGDTGVNNFSAQDPVDPVDLFRAPSYPNVPGGVSSPLNLMTGDPTISMSFGGSGSGSFPEFGAATGPN